MDIKEIVNSYTEKDSDNPIYAAFNLITFAKAIPWHIGKAVILALLLYFVLTFAMYKMGFSFVFLFIGFVLGLIWAVIVGVTAGIKFITSGLIGNFTDLLTGVVEPVDQMYDKWQSTSGEDGSRAAFFRDVTKEVIVPEFTSMLTFLPFKGSIEKFIQLFLDRVFDGLGKEGTDAATLDISPTANTSKSDKAPTKSYAATVVDSIDEGTGHVQSKISAPFWKAIKWGLILWGGMFLLHWLMGGMG